MDIERLISYGCNNFTTWVSNPLKTPSYSLLFQHPSPPSSVSQECLVCVSLWVGTLFFILSVCVLYSVCSYRVLGVLSYRHKKRILSLILGVSLSLSYWCVSPTLLLLLLYSESLLGLVLRKSYSFLSLFSLLLRIGLGYTYKSSFLIASFIRK